MKQKLSLIASILMLAATSASAQWVFTGGPATDGKAIDAIARIDTNLLAGGYNGVYQWIGDTVWTLIGLSPAYVQALTVNGTNLFAGTSDGVYFTNNGGQNWVYDTNGMGGQYVYAVAMSGSNIVAGTDNGIFFSGNDGANWTSSNDFDNTFALAATGTNLFAGGVGVSLSTDNGMTWTELNNNLSNIDINALTVNGGNLFAETDGIGIFLSNDNGSSWNPANNGLPSHNVYALQTAGSKLFAGTDSGVFLSLNNGASWLWVNDSLPPYTPVYSFATDGTNLFAGTGLGVYERKLAEMNAADPIPDGVAPVAATANSIAAYPNPFTQLTTINFSSAESGTVEVTIFNLLGSEVARIFSGELAAGEHSFIWDKPAGLTPGMYECIVRMNGRSQQIPILLVQ